MTELRVKTLPREYHAGERSRPQPMYCEVCSAPTRERKPFCPKHLERGSLNAVRAKMAARLEEERMAMLKTPRVDLDGMLVKETLAILRIHESMLVALLSRQMNIEFAAMVGVAKAMIKAGLVDHETSRRESIRLFALGKKALVLSRERHAVALRWEAQRRQAALPSPPKRACNQVHAAPPVPPSPATYY